MGCRLHSNTDHVGFVVLVSKHILNESSVEFGNMAVSFPLFGFAVCLKLSCFPSRSSPHNQKPTSNFSPQH